MRLIEFFTSLFKKKPVPPVLLKWGVSTLNPDGGTQCLPVSGSGGQASSTDWSVGLIQVGTPGVTYGMTTLVIDADPVPGWLNVQVQRYSGGIPTSGWLPSVVLSGGASHAEVNLGDVLVDGANSFQAQAAYSPNANSVPATNVRVTLTLNKK